MDQICEPEDDNGLYPNPELPAATRTCPGASGLGRGRAGVSGSGWPACYEFRVEGVLDNRWADWFAGLQVTGDGTQTIISGLLADQPALHGALAKIRDLGLCLISVRRLDPNPPEPTRP